MKKFFCVLAVLLIKFNLFILDHASLAAPAQVVIVGGGPAGLATAIEARLAGAKVLVVEKRSEYTRPQGVFLQDHSIGLLKKWGVVTDGMAIMQITPDENIGFVKLRILEESLAKRVKEMNIEMIRGSFAHLNSDQTITVTPDTNLPFKLSYDFLVGADGIHSKTREALGIAVNHLGAAKALATFVPLVPSILPLVEISPPIQGSTYFLKRIKIPVGSVIFMQSFAPISQEQFRQAVAKEGWQHEADFLAEKASLSFDVILQQAQSFSDLNKSALLVGDAAATASFFRGLGANTAFKTVEAAGTFFQTVQQEGSAAYDMFNHSVKLATDAMIQDSQFLFDYSLPLRY